jgi:hypothetical protein
MQTNSNQATVITGINYAYAYDGYGSAMVPKPKKGISAFAKNIIDKIHDDSEDSEDSNMVSEERVMPSKPIRVKSVDRISHSDISESFLRSDSFIESYSGSEGISEGPSQG